MAIFLDVLTVLVFVVVIYRECKKGLLRALIDLVGFVASFVVAFLLSDPLGRWINSNFLSKFVKGTVNQLASSSGKGNKTFFTNFISSFPDAVGKSLSGINKGLGAFGEKAMQNVADSVSAPISSLISRGIAFFIILVLCLFVVGIVSHISEIVKHLPLIGKLNALGGAAIGLLKAIIIMFVISTFVSLGVSFMALQKNPPITKATINSTYIYKYIQNINPLTGMLLKK